MRPTILQVIPAFESGGVEMEALEMGNAIVKAGGRALIAAKLGKMANDPLAKEIELIDLPLNSKNPLRMIHNTKLLKKIILKEKVDIVHVRSRAPAWSAYKAARSLGIPLVSTYHAAYRSQTIFKTFYNAIMAKGDRVIAISQFILDHIMEQYSEYSWFDPSKIRLIHRGIDLHYFDPSTISSEQVERLRESWGLSPEARILLLPGRVSKTKGQDLLIEALSLMKHVDVVAVLVGSAQGHESYRDNLLQFASSLGLEGRVKWMPPYHDIAVAYQLADVILCPSLAPEGFGRVMIEAQAMKKPIVAANHGAAREIIEEGVTGWLPPPGNPQALAHTLDEALNLSQNQLLEIGEQSRARVISQFSKETMAFKTLAVYQELLEGKK